MDTSIAVEVATWIGIGLCITQSAMFSGLNLAVFSISRLRLEVEVAAGDTNAVQVLHIRQDANFVLTTILWGNVGINVLLTLLSDSVLAGIGAFVFSTVVITFMGEIIPQAYFSRHALRMAALLTPVLKGYQVLLYPVAKPVALLLDWWLGPEGMVYYDEQDLRQVIQKHIEAEETDVSHMEGVGALNFLAMDDIAVVQEGEPVAPNSIIPLPMQAGLPVFPTLSRSPDDPFLQRIQTSEKKWVIITDPAGEPHLVVETNNFLRRALFGQQPFNPYADCHRPIVVRDPAVLLGHVIERLRVDAHHPGDDVIDHDIILLWGTEKRIITGADILGRLLRGIVNHNAQAAHRGPL